VRRPRAISTDGARLAALAALALLLCACAGAGVVDDGEPSQAARLVLDCDVGDASVWIDGRYIGEVGHLEGGIPLSPGTRRVEVRHDHFHTYYERITLEPHERKRVEVHLARELR
jgi:hypothetical protein